MKPKLLLSAAWIVISASSCSKEHASARMDNDSTVNGLNLRIAVVSDIHFLDTLLLKNNASGGTAFQTYLKFDPKLVQYSEPIFRTVITQLKSEKPDILLIPGDLTKDGEKICHESMAGMLKELADVNIKVLVIPGNHDINNPYATAYDGNKASSTQTISAKDFSTIYAPYGYGDAFSRDSGSLSYLSKPYPGLWILALDDCEYEDNKSFPIVGGKIKPGTMKWALGWIREAAVKHIPIYAMMHHNLIEHYGGETLFDPGYVTDNGEEEADEFIKAGLSVIFTGHYHANDVTKRVTGDKELYDIETGSLITTPSPYRIITVKNNAFDISTRYVTSISAELPGGLDFQSYSALFLSSHLDDYFGNILAQPPYSIPGNEISFDAPRFRNAFMAHFAGDENISAEEKANDEVLGKLSPVAGIALSTLWTDINTTDNNTHIQFPAP